MSEKVDLGKVKAWVKAERPIEVCEGGWTEGFSIACAHIEALIAEVERLRAKVERLELEVDYLNNELAAADEALAEEGLSSDCDDDAGWWLAAY